MRPLGLYLHIPFCRSKCLYCDFCSRPNVGEETVERYVAALCRELAARSEACADYTVDTVYLGGGTPTYLSHAQLERIMETVFLHYRVASEAEITAECNPATADREKLSRMRKSGIDRLSIGLQSVHPQELKALGRLHSFADLCSIWETARAVGFENLSLDVMLGIPHQTAESFCETLERACELSPSHLSAYALTVEPNTPFGRRGEDALQLPQEEAVREMYLGMIDRLAEHGLAQYEISNFARPGRESRHNLKYWNTEEYLGFGPAAHSDFGGCRFGNRPSLEDYLAGKEMTEERSIPSPEERLQEYVMLRMRLTEGLSEREMSQRFGAAAWERFRAALEPYTKGDFVRFTAQGCRFTPAGMLVSNSILSDILDFSE